MNQNYNLNTSNRKITFYKITAMKKFIVLFTLFSLITASNTTFASVMQEDSLAQKIEITEENPLFVRGITPEGDTIMFNMVDTTKKITVTKTINIGPFKSKQWTEEVVADSIPFLFRNVKYLLIISLLIYLCIFVAIIALIVYFIKSNQKRENQKLELISKCIESGQPIPEQLIKDTNTKERYRKNGIIWLLMGIGLSFLFFPFGAIIICVGIAYFVLYFIEKK